jgi:hypothetical protein
MDKRCIFENPRVRDQAKSVDGVLVWTVLAVTDEAVLVKRERRGLLVEYRAYSPAGWRGCFAETPTRTADSPEWSNGWEA